MGRAVNPVHHACRFLRFGNGFSFGAGFGKVSRAYTGLLRIGRAQFASGTRLNLKKSMGTFFKHQEEHEGPTAISRAQRFLARTHFHD
jgi:hypothetical protein